MNVWLQPSCWWEWVPCWEFEQKNRGLNELGTQVSFFSRRVVSLVRVVIIYLMSSYCCLLCSSLYEYKISSLRSTYFRIFRAPTFILDRTKKPINSTFDLPLKICSAQLHLILVFQKSQQATSGSTVHWTHRGAYINMTRIKLHYWKCQ